jgi:hypothetical protein
MRMRKFGGLLLARRVAILAVMKTFRLAMVGLGVAALCLGGCAERPGQKKDEKKDEKKAGDEKADKKAEKKAEAKE